MKKYALSGTVGLLSLMLAGQAHAAGSTQVITPPPPITIPAPAAVPSTPAEDPVQTLNEAIKAYQAGKYNDAISKIDEAKKGVSTKHLEIYKALLPPAPGAQWATADKPDTILLSNVSRDYSANGQTVTISISVDANINKMLASTAKMLSAMTNLGGDAGDNDLSVDGNKASYQEVKLGDKVLLHKLTVTAGEVVVNVQSPTIGKDTLLKFAGLIDYDKLKAAH